MGTVLISRQYQRNDDTIQNGAILTKLRLGILIEKKGAALATRRALSSWKISIPLQGEHYDFLLNGIFMFISLQSLATVHDCPKAHTSYTTPPAIFESRLP